MKERWMLGICALMLILSGCKEDTATNVAASEPGNTLFTLMTPEDTGIAFTNRVENQKDFNIFKYRNFYNGGGVAIGDVNNDGLPDIFFTANMGPNKLYLNKGNFQFEDISETAGIQGNKPWTTGVVMVDINQDGFLDIYVSNAGHMEADNHDNDLYINNGEKYPIKTIGYLDRSQDPTALSANSYRLGKK